MNAADIDYYKNDLEILFLTAEQIKKDFLSLNIDLLGNKEKINFEELREGLFEVVGYMLDSRPGDFIPLLYRIDISEAQLHNLLKNNSGTPVALQLTDLILKRELLKVVYRKYWGKSV